MTTSGPLEVLIVTTQSHRELANQFFLPTLSAVDGAPIRECQLDVAGAGSYGSTSWQTGVTAKLRWALDYLETVDDGTAFVLSDVDIQFFDGFSTRALAQLLHDSAGPDVLFQKEHRSAESLEVNTGFYVARKSAWLRDLLEQAIAVTESSDVKNDQTAINSLLRAEDLGARWGFLPLSYYARSQGFPPRGPVVLHHANFSGTIAAKVGQLTRVRKYLTGGVVDRMSALAGEGTDYVRSGKLRTSVRIRVKGR